LYKGKGDEWFAGVADFVSRELFGEFLFGKESCPKHGGWRGYSVKPMGCNLHHHMVPRCSKNQNR